MSSDFRLLSDSIQTCLKNCKGFIFCLLISDCFTLVGDLTEEENAGAVSATKHNEDLKRTDLELHMEDAARDLERHMEALLEAAEIVDRGVHEGTKRAKVKAATAKAAVKSADSISSTGTSPVATVVSTT